MNTDFQNNIQTTADGSKTVFSKVFNETYHSVNGAITESNHVFVNSAFNECKLDTIHVFEIGFGTGLNAILTFVEAEKRNVSVIYHAIDLYPISNELINELNYCNFVPVNYHRDVENILLSNWNEKIVISQTFTLQKFHTDLITFPYPQKYDIVYFDAFSPVTQPEMWSDNVLRKLYLSMNDGGILTTYCAKGEVRRTMQRSGFVVERIPGPPGKREMLRARKQ